MNNIDNRNQLNEDPFSYKTLKSEIVIIYRNNKQVMIVKGKTAIKLQIKLSNQSETQIQLVLAKITGNYKR